jgi:transcriptional antiterminator RfaH
MPILKNECDFYPEDLWLHESETPCAPDGQLWWCLHTKPRQEKAVARDLRNAGMDFYLPQVVHKTRTPQGRQIQSLVPLFTSYLFLHGGAEAAAAVVWGGRVVNVLQISDQESIRQDLLRIHRLLSSGLPIGQEKRIESGTIVRINSGPLAGLEGTVSRRSNGDHFVAIVGFLSQGASVELQDWQVEPILDRSTASSAAPR